MVMHDVRFPPRLSRGATGGPERRTDIVVLGSGREERNTRWADSRRRYNAGTGARTLDDLYEMTAFFEARGGQLNAFRWKDLADYKSSRPSQPITQLDQFVGRADGVETVFPLRKRYGDGASEYWRDIRLPVVSSLRVAVDGVEVIIPEAVAFDPSVFALRFTPQAIPPAGSTITAGFEFDVPVRFDTDRLEISVSSFQHGVIPSIPVVEVRL